MAATGARASEALQRHLAANFGPENPLGQETSWFRFIGEVECCSAWDGEAIVETSLYNDIDAVQPAAAICTAALLSGVDGLASVRVTDASGDTIDQCGA